MAWLEPIALRGQHVHLVPLEISHREGLEQAARDGELWRLWYTSVPSPDGMAKEIERRLRLQSQGTMLPWTVVDAVTGTIAGMTTYMNVDQGNRRVEIGSTWYAKRVQRTPLNTECKLMLLAPRFRDAGLHRCRIPDLVLQSAEPQGDRAFGGQARRHPAQSYPPCRRLVARHVRLQHPSVRMAGRAFASCVSA